MYLELKNAILSAIGVITLVYCIMSGANACTSSQWNMGICPECNTRYELRDVYNHVKYYACPECEKIVARY